MYLKYIFKIIFSNLIYYKYYSTWGEDGYVLICKDCNKNGEKGECGILEEPVYPIPETN